MSTIQKPPPPPTPSSVLVVHRVEVRRRPGVPDPRADAVVHQALVLGLGVRRAAVARVYLIEAPLSRSQIIAACDKLLADPVTEIATTGAEPPAGVLVEVHPQSGVMDPAAQSVRDALRELTGVEALVSTGWRYDLEGVDRTTARLFAETALCNPVIHKVHDEPFHPRELPRGHDRPFEARTIAIRDLTDDQLVKMSRDAHLFLSLDEMRAVQAEYRTLKRDPRDIELETIAQTWSEHCVHKTLKSTVRYTSPFGTNDVIRWEGRPGHSINPDGSVTINNLLKSTVAAATFELIAEGVDWTLSVFKDNSGVIALDERWGVNIKVETHNHPSAIEPYGGAATGIGGCIRDVIATGLGAKPIASTDVFCVASPDLKDLPPGCLPPRRVLRDVVAGVRDYGNRMGIPTVSGNVAFDDRYIGNPLVFCGCIGLIPRSMINGAARPGDRIIALGGRTGRDGIHGATFSSAEMEHTHADEFAHAVQIGNAIEEKRLLDAILRARDAKLYTAMTDCGAGGFSSAVGEMGGKIGAKVDLDRAPLKYAGLTYTEIWISEAQERIVLSVPPANLAALKRICDEEHVELADLGEFGTPTQGTHGPDLILRFNATEVGRLSMHFLHEGIPMPTREAVWERGSGEVAKWRSDQSSPAASPTSALRHSVTSSLLSLLAHPNIASKHWIIRQYDHEVQGNVVAKPLVGPAGRGPGDAAVLEPVPGTGRGIAISQGLQTPVGDPAFGGDPYQMTLSAIDECVRNLVCVGADPDQIAILDNFCWPSCSDPRNMGSLVRAAEGCYDGAKAYRTPFVSGKDSLNNQLRFTDPATGEARVIEIPPTLLVTGIGIVPSVQRTVTMDAKKAGHALILIGETTGKMGASAWAAGQEAQIPAVDLLKGPATARAVAEMIRTGLVESAHDCSEGGLLVALAEMLIATTGSPAGAHGPLGAEINASESLLEHHQWAFGEDPSRYVLEVTPENLPHVRQVLTDFGARVGGLRHSLIGRLTTSARLTWQPAGVDIPVADLAAAWLGTLDW